MALWGGTFIAGRTLSQTLSPHSAAFCRFAVAAVGMVLLLWSQGERLPRLKATQILPVVVLGLSGVLVYNVCFFSGLQTITASRAGLIIALNPIFITLCSALLFRQPLPPLSLAGTAVALLGAALVLSEGQLQTLLSQGVSQGDLWLLGCVGSWVVYSLVGKQVMAVVNFPARQIGPMRSEILVLGLPDEAGEIALLAPDQQVPNGGRMH